MAQEKQTQRQKQSQQALRAKAKRKRNHARNLKLKIAGGIGAVCLAITIAVLSYTGTINRWHTQTIAAFDTVTTRYGFAVETIYLDGRSRTPAHAVEEALRIPRGEPILTLSLREVQTRLEAIPTIKAASVERALPNTLHVKITEREPVAIWQHNQKLALLDDTGAVMTDLAVENYVNLPLFIGAGVPENIKEGLALKALAESTPNHIHHLTRIGNRRWDITLNSSVTIRLPEKGFVEAWQKLAALNAETQLTERAIKVIDMRDSSRLTIQRVVIPTEAPKLASQDT